MSKPKFIKPLILGTACAVPVGLIVGLSINWDHTQYISSVGSSAVKGFVEKFGKQYHKINKKIDVTVESGGTTFAIEQVAKNYANIGNASNNPFANIKSDGFLQQWEGKKTFTLGWEGVVLMYSLPDGLSNEAQRDFDIVINQSNIRQLYAIFSAYHELADGTKWDKNAESLWFYATQEAKNKITNEEDIKLLKETPILPFTRTGGNTGANGCTAFSVYSNLIDFWGNDLTENQQKAFLGGQWGNDNDYMETDDSNARAWQSFTTKNQQCSMTYLTTSFLTNDNNIKLIKEKGYKLAKYQSINSQIAEFNLDDIKGSLEKMSTKDGYNWYRPINIMVNLEDNKTIDFIKWIFDSNNHDKFIETIHSLGAKPVTDEQIKSMCANGDTNKLFDKESSDIELDNNKTEQFKYKNIYGAEDLWN